MKLLFSFFVLLTIGLCNTNAQNLKVITFNIKVDSKADGINQWKNRKPLLMRFLSKENPDIFCLQEVLLNQLDDFRMSFQMYDYVGVSRIDGNTKGDFVPIFYRKDKLEQINSGTFCLSEKPDSIGCIGWDAKYPRIATWINLRIRESGDTVLVLNTHLDNAGKIAREEGMKLIIEKLSLFSKSNKIILTGDLNASASSKVHDIALHEGFQDTYLVSRKIKGVHYSFHQFGQIDFENRKKLDYVFTDKTIKTIRVTIPKEKPKRGVYISDHNPIIVKMKF